MSISARLVSCPPSPPATSTFSGLRVQIDEQLWSPAFSTQLSAWATDSLTLVILDGGVAVLSDPGSAVPFGEAVLDHWTRAPHLVPRAGRQRVVGLCTVMRFDPAVVGPAPSPISAFSAGATGEDQLGLESPLQLGPAALFQYYWRRRALRLQYPAPEAHVEEDALALLRYVISRTRPIGRPTRLVDSRRLARHRSLAEATQKLMARDIASPHPITSMARGLGTSPYHLAHVFRAQVGVSVHQYLLHLRMAAALGQLQEGSTDLSKLALELGFSHHSHFSSVFRRTLGHAPSAVRRMLIATNVADLGIASRQCG